MTNVPALVSTTACFGGVWPRLADEPAEERSVASRADGGRDATSVEAASFACHAAGASMIRRACQM